MTVDLLDLTTFVESREYDAFRTLRDTAPVAHNPEPDGPGFWSVTRYAHVNEAARDHARLLSGQG